MNDVDDEGREHEPGSDVPALPDLRGADRPSLPDHRGQYDEEDSQEPSENARRRARTTIIAVVATSVVVLGVLALVLSQTLLRSPYDPEPIATPSGQRQAEGHDEYVPDPDDPELAPPPPLFTEQPTTNCTVPAPSGAPRASQRDRIRGGDLEFTIPSAWDYPWSQGGLPYMTKIGAQARNVEGSWYSVVNVGEVQWPDDEDGGYPGTEQAAVAIFQCYATTAGVLSHFGENPTVTDYRTESTDVDGHEAWIVQATYHFEDPDMLSTTSASVVTSIVVETDNGPMALASDVAADHEDHVAELEEIIASLEVVD